jgi:ferric-dicitrate binding protein FerR (iron transport regulator)
MNPPDAHPSDPAADPLEQALRAWAAPPLADDGFTQAVLRRVALARGRPGLAPADALQQLQARQRQEARRLRRSGLGLLLGMAMALAWLLASAGSPGGQADMAAPWMLWLGAALAGSAGALAWLTQAID